MGSHHNTATIRGRVLSFIAFVMYYLELFFGVCGGGVRPWGELTMSCHALLCIRLLYHSLGYDMPVRASIYIPKRKGEALLSVQHCRRERERDVVIPPAFFVSTVVYCVVV